MRNYPPAGICAAVVLCALQGCAATGSLNLPADADSATVIPAADPAHDHYIAWVPKAQAQTAAIARALTHISLGNARERAGTELCAGSWLLNGQVTTRVGPLPATAPAAAGGYPAWYYRVSKRPGLHGCTAVGNARLYRSVQHYLPDWISIRTAVTATPETLTLLE